ncbi:MAG TPA: FAD-dependent oxidoreductase [Acidimicrobiia bacterium]|nr:FAD-dependent oxidoreductase [Acidimicrobiia bacterium]
MTSAEMAGRRQTLEYARFLVDRVPGYENASLIDLSSQIGTRETRRVQGDYRVTREDVLSARQFDDQIGLCGTPIEDHLPGKGTVWEYVPEGEAVGIPFSALIPRDGVNTLVAGRCLSAPTTPSLHSLHGPMHGDGSGSRDGGSPRRGERRDREERRASVLSGWSAFYYGEQFSFLARTRRRCRT